MRRKCSRLAASIAAGTHRALSAPSSARTSPKGLKVDGAVPLRLGIGGCSAASAAPGRPGRLGERVHHIVNLNLGSCARTSAAVHPPQRTGVALAGRGEEARTAALVAVGTATDPLRVLFIVYR